MDANVGDAMDGPAISEEEHEVVLHEEEVVTEKRTVPKERMRLNKDVEVEEKTVNERVRSEQVELIDGKAEPAQGRDGVRATDGGV
jgi:stress response protein YsnF